MAKLYSETEIVAQVEGLTVRRLRAFVAARCVLPAHREGAAGAAFDEADRARLQLLTELSTDFELDEDAAAMVLSLIDQIHGLRTTLRHVVRAVSDEPDEVRARIRARLPQ